MMGAIRKTMKTLIAICLLVPAVVFAAGGETLIPLDEMEPNLEDQASLQRGADRKSVV